MMLRKNLEKAARILKNADSLVITAGAGIGVDSGLPDFRGNEGFWRAYPPIAKLGESFVEMANPQQRWRLLSLERGTRFPPCGVFPSR
jgi:NAD-dependent SIR2 family protein deacetylase